MIDVMARFETDHGSKYLQQMCKHFAHKVPAEWTTEVGQVTFQPGIARFTADDKGLVLQCAAANIDQLVMLAKIVIVHLERFAYRETLDLVWMRDGEPDTALNARLKAMPDPHGETRDDPDEDNDQPPTVH